VRVVNVDGSRLELNFMWLPTFISQNMHVMRELEQEWRRTFSSYPATEENLDVIHDWTIGWLANRFNIPGLITYLSAIKEVKEDDDGVHKDSGQGVLLGSQERLDRAAG
jgi:hypothetical protein